MSAPASKRNKVSDEEKDCCDSRHGITSLDGFQVQSVLSVDPRAKSLAVCGTFSSDVSSDDRAVIVAEKHPLTSECLPHLFSASTKLKCNLNNDIYGQYVCDAAGGGVGRVQLSTVYPASDKHISKYTDQALHLVSETPSQYHDITKPFIDSQAQLSTQVSKY